MGRRRTDPMVGRAALVAWLEGRADKKTTTTAVRFTLEELAEVAPGHAVEVRVPPAGAVQCVDGPQHTRGTPPNVVEMDVETWLALASGQLEWTQALDQALVSASGERADLREWLPLQVARLRSHGA